MKQKSFLFSRSIFALVLLVLTFAWPPPAAFAQVIIPQADIEPVFTNKDLSSSTNTYRSASTSISGAVELATNAEAAAGASATLVPTVEGAATLARVLAGYETPNRYSSARPDPLALATMRNRWFGSTTNGINFAQNVTFGEKKNVWEYTENLGANWYTGDNLTKGSGSEVITIDGMTLRRVSGVNHFFGRLYSGMNGLGLSLLNTGDYYIASVYVWSAKAIDHWPVLSRNDSTQYNFERKYIPARQLRRIWTLWRAKSANTVDRGDFPTIAYGSGATQFNLLWPISGGYPSATLFTTGASVENSIDYYVGAFQIEKVSSDGRYGFIARGDSTTCLNSDAGLDYAESQDWPGFLAAHLNVQGFNRGIPGGNAATMDSRWATDITPIAARAKYVLIQPSFHNDRDTLLTSIQASVNSMIAKAIADGLIPVLVVPDPSPTIATTPPAESPIANYAAHYDALVAWIKTFPLVLDGGRVVADPWNRHAIRSDYHLNANDAVHCNITGNQAKAREFAAASFWDFPEPSAYQPVPSGTSSYVAPDIAIYGGTKQIMGTNRAANVATLTSGTVTVSNTRVTAASKIRLTRQAKNSSTAIGSLNVGTISAGTSFVIQSLKSDATVETGDASTVLWEILEPTS